MIAIDYEQISMRLRTLGPGQRVVYFVGYLDSERLERPNGLASLTADVALGLSKKGLVFLVQRRLGPPVCRACIDWRLGHGPGFEYIAIGAGGKLNAAHD